jgi:hypothetical protein
MTSESRDVANFSVAGKNPLNPTAHIESEVTLTPSVVSTKTKSLPSHQFISGAQLDAEILPLCSFLTVSIWKREMEEINNSEQPKGGEINFPDPISQYYMQQVVNGKPQISLFSFGIFLNAAVLIRQQPLQRNSPCCGGSAIGMRRSYAISTRSSTARWIKSRVLRQNNMSW